jgi:hypothetical protein
MSFTSFLQVLHSFWTKSWSELGQMDSPSWYSVISGCLIATWLLVSGVYRVLRVLASWCFGLALKHLVYPHLIPRIPFIGTATRFEGLLSFLYLLANTLLVLIGTSADIGSRAAALSIINVIPLLCGPRLSLVAKLLGISVHTSTWSHQWFGRAAVAQALLHTVTSLTASNSLMDHCERVRGGSRCPALPDRNAC